jgi:endonuclease/exonuclease/phosphatase family metal-dependent hydrolase
MILQTLALTVMLLAPSSDHRFGLTEAMPRIDGTIRVATYNMLNFYDEDGYNHMPKLNARPGHISWELSDILDSDGKQIPHTSKERRRELARVIKEIDADILLLQEIESKETLATFNDNELDELGCRYEFIASEDVGYYRGVEQSILSRFPIKDIKTWVDADLSKIKRTGEGWSQIPHNTANIRFQRSPLCVTVTTPEGYELTLFSIHLKAGRNAWHRELESLQIMEYIEAMTKKNPNRNIAVIGDFNAQPWDRSTRVYLRNGMIDALSFRAMNLKWDDTSPLRKTHTSGRLIDFIMLNSAAVGELVIDSGFVLGSAHPEYDWKNDPIPAGYSSDHCAIAVDMVPREGAGGSAKAAPWPEALTTTALKNSPIAPSTPNLSSGSAESETSSPDTSPFLASKRSKVFHKAGCGHANRISDKNKVGYPTFSDAEGAGKQPAKCCKPTAN